MELSNLLQSSRSERSIKVDSTVKKSGMHIIYLFIFPAFGMKSHEELI